jgi:predicted nuclease of predicted toxin-antitoxin system
VKLKLDENLPESLVTELAALNHDVDSVRQEGLSGRADPEIWAAAQGASRFLITQDLDFSDVRQFRPGTHYGLLLVRLPDAGRSALTRRVVEVFRKENVGSWTGCFAVLSGHKLRVLRPTGE